MKYDFTRGFTITGPSPFMTEEWLYQEDKSNDSKLVFYGYDANLYPSPNFSNRPETEWNKKVIDRALEVTKYFKGEVWLDDVCIKRSPKKNDTE